MTIKEHISYWLDSAEHDLETSNTLFEAGKYDWSLFIGHSETLHSISEDFIYKKVMESPLYIPKSRN